MKQIQNISVIMEDIFPLIRIRQKQKFIPKCAFVFGANLSLISVILLHYICNTSIFFFLFTGSYNMGMYILNRKYHNNSARKVEKETKGTT